MFSFEERLHLGDYVTSKLTRSAPIYDWFVFPHSFSRELVHELIDELRVPSDSCVYDPFVGAGTTLLACRERGIPAFGLDQLPLAVFVSLVKTRDYDADSLERTFDGFELRENGRRGFGAVPIVERAFSDEAKGAILGVYNWAQSLPDPTHAGFFTLALLSILEQASCAKKSGGWLRLTETKVDPAAIEPTFRQRAEKMIADVRREQLPANRDRWTARLGDARGRATRRPVHFVITSPPYLNRHDYTRIFALEMALHFVASNRDLISLRAASLRSHVEARPRPSVRCNGYVLPSRLAEVLADLAGANQRRQDGRVAKMIRGYFEDMYMTLLTLREQVVEGGKIAFVLGNVRFDGVMIPVDEIVAEIGEQVGLQVNSIIVARYRGNSAQQMARFGREPSRESVIVWTRQ